MNLTYIKDFLTTRKENITKNDVETLISEINAYQGTERIFLDISKIMKTINEYNLTFLTRVQEYEAMPKNTIALMPTRMEKVREILSTLSMLHTYLVLSMTRIKDSTFDMKNIRNYITDLNERKEHFKSEKMTWAVVLKSLIQETAFTSEMRRMDIEEELGYTRNTSKE